MKTYKITKISKELQELAKEKINEALKKCHDFKASGESAITNIFLKNDFSFCVFERFEKYTTSTDFVFDFRNLKVRRITLTSPLED